MFQFLRIAIAVLAFGASSASAQTLVKPGTCELIVAARQTFSAAQTYVRGIDDKRFVKVFKAGNGWYAISIGALKPDEEEPVMKAWKASGKIPNDAYCSKGKTYTAAYNWKTGAPLDAPKTVVAGKTQVWHGWGVQNSGSKWAMELTLGSSGARVNYPTQGCLGKWVYLKNSGGKSHYKEVITKQGHRRCTPVGYVAVNLLDNGNLAFSFAKTPTSSPTARAVLLRGSLAKSKYSNAQLTNLTQRYIDGGHKLAPRSNSGGGADLLGALLLGVAGALADSASSSSSSSSSGSSSSSAYTQKYGCEFVCEGSFGTARSSKIRVNTPHTNSASAQDYVRREYKAYCENNFGFHGGQSTGADVSYPYCETYYYE